MASALCVLSVFPCVLCVNQELPFDGDEDARGQRWALPLMKRSISSARRAASDSPRAMSRLA